MEAGVAQDRQTRDNTPWYGTQPNANQVNESWNVYNQRSFQAPDASPYHEFREFVGFRCPLQAASPRIAVVFAD
jgi:hypothetical protein